MKISGSSLILETVGQLNNNSLTSSMSKQKESRNIKQLSILSSKQ